MALTLVGTHFLPLYIDTDDKPGRAFCACGWHSPICPDQVERMKWWHHHLDDPEWDPEVWGPIDQLWCIAHPEPEGMAYWLAVAEEAYRQAAEEVL
jgi:hypothetical protein